MDRQTMTYRGRVGNGVVVFEKAAPLEDGTAVRVTPEKRPRGAKEREKVQSRKPRRASGPAFRPVGSWDGPPGELDRLLAEVQRMRDQDLVFERAREPFGIAKQSKQFVDCAARVAILVAASPQPT